MSFPSAVGALRRERSIRVIPDAPALAKEVYIAWLRRIAHSESALGHLRRPYYTSADGERMLPGWLEHYNCAGPHGSLDEQPL